MVRLSDRPAGHLLTIVFGSPTGAFPFSSRTQTAPPRSLALAPQSTKSSSVCHTDFAEVGRWSEWYVVLDTVRLYSLPNFRRSHQLHHAFCTRRTRLGQATKLGPLLGRHCYRVGSANRSPFSAVRLGLFLQILRLSIPLKLRSLLVGTFYVNWQASRAFPMGAASRLEIKLEREYFLIYRLPRRHRYW